MDKPRVVHCKRVPSAKYVGRPGVLGNDYSHKPGTRAKFKVATVAEAVQSFKVAAIERMKTDPAFAEAIRGCRGQQLSCWCAGPEGLPADINGTRCHAQIIAALSDSGLA